MSCFIHVNVFYICFVEAEDAAQVWDYSADRFSSIMTYSFLQQQTCQGHDDVYESRVICNVRSSFRMFETRSKWWWPNITKDMNHLNVCGIPASSDLICECSPVSWSLLQRPTCLLHFSSAANPTGNLNVFDKTKNICEENISQIYRSSRNKNLQKQHTGFISISHSGLRELRSKVTWPAK